MDEGDPGGNAALHGKGTVFGPIKPNGAAIRLDHAAQDFHERRFAGAVFSDEADDLAGADIHREIVERDDARVGLANSRKAEKWQRGFR